MHGLLNRWDYIERTGGLGCKGCKRSKLPRSPKCNSPSTNNSRSRSQSPARDSTRGELSGCKSTLYRGLAEQRRDFKFGRSRSHGHRGDQCSLEAITNHLHKLYLSEGSFFTGVQSLEELEVQEKRALDWSFSKPIDKEDWLHFLKFFYYCACLCDLF